MRKSLHRGADTISSLFRVLSSSVEPKEVFRQFRNTGASSIPSSGDSTWNGKPAPSSYIHKLVDITRFGSSVDILKVEV